jgi:HEAT repeat protein
MSIDELLGDLGSDDARVRDCAALRLMDLQDARAVAPLVRAILAPDNVNHRGTLIHALGAFDCSEHVEMLLDLTLGGNFEVSVTAYSIVTEMNLSSSIVAKIRRYLKSHVSDRELLEHQADARVALERLADSSEST